MRKTCLVGFICHSPAEQNKCFEIAERFFDARGVRIFRRDALYPARATQKVIHAMLGLPDPGNTADPQTFALDEHFFHYFLELYEARHLGAYLKNCIQQIQRAHGECPVAVITTDARNKVSSTMRELGYAIVRLEPPVPFEREEVRYENVIEEDYCIARKDFSKKPKAIITAILEKIIKDKRA